MTAVTKKVTPTYLQDLLYIKVQALYDIEKELVVALSTMDRHATDDELADAFAMHTDETKTHAERLEKVFSILDKQPSKMKVAAIRGLVDDAEWMIKHVDDLRARDVILISAGLETEHYEMAAYMSAIEWASLLGFNDIHELLTANLGEEQVAAEKLQSLGSGGVYEAAIGDDTEESEKSA